MRGLDLVWRIAGWLLAPLVVWAVSLWGAWIAFGLIGGIESARTALLVVFATALAVGTVALLLWMRVLRRSPRLRHSLHVNRDGLPVIDDPEPVPAPLVPPTTETPISEKAS